MSRGLGPWFVAGTVVVAALFALFSAPSVEPPLGRGSRAPDFELVSLGGDRVSMKTLRGDVVLINFWATWCKPCEDEMPAMERLYRALRSEGFQLLAISVDESVEPVIEFSQRLGLSFPILMDEERRATTGYQTFRYPESFLVDRDGKILERYIGPKDWDSPVYVERIRRVLRAEATGQAGVAAAEGRG
jgi:peroxiredoxin